MAFRSKNLRKEEDSLLISGINTSKIQKQLEGRINGSNLVSSRLELSSSRVSDDPIKVQDSFSISEIYREVETNKENLLAELYEPSICNQENSDFFRLLEENTGIRQKTYSKLDESSIVGENCKVILKNPVNEATPLMKKQQKKYYKAFMIMQALFISAKESTERKVSSLNTQIAEVNHMKTKNLKID